MTVPFGVTVNFSVHVKRGTEFLSYVHVESSFMCIIHSRITIKQLSFIKLNFVHTEFQQLLSSDVRLCNKSYSPACSRDTMASSEDR